jgi:hypothetical protein
MTPRGRSIGNRRNRRGMLTFEWMLITALLVVGLVGGVALVRTAIVDHYKALITCICSTDVCDCNACDTCNP